MKKMIVGIALATLPMTGMAGGYSAAGCGVGSMIFEGSTGAGPHILAATTNGSYGTQTFAMTSGTLGCDTTGTINSQTASYINGNLDVIAADVARGEGESLDALASLFGISAEDSGHFAAVLKKDFDIIFSSADTNAGIVMGEIVVALSKDSRLVKYVG